MNHYKKIRIETSADRFETLIKTFGKNIPTYSIKGNSNGEIYEIESKNSKIIDFAKEEGLA